MSSHEASIQRPRLINGGSNLQQPLARLGRFKGAKLLPLKVMYLEPAAIGSGGAASASPDVHLETMPPPHQALS